MKKNKFINKYVKLSCMLLLTFVVLQSCNNNDNEPEAIFEDSASVRYKKQIDELRATLRSSQDGWKTTYFTDNELLGGFTFLFKFTDDQNVEMASDLTDDTTSQTSEYDISVGSTVKLVFTTRNKIHDLSDSDNYPDPGLEGEGYKGDFNFLYYGQENEELIFKTEKSFVELRFKKAVADDWRDIANNRVMMQRMIGSPNNSVFRAFVKGDVPYALDYNTNRRYAKLNGQAESFGVGIGFNPNGISISPTIEHEGIMIENLDYNATEDSFETTSGGNVIAAIRYSNTPFFPLNPYDFDGNENDGNGIRITRTNSDLLNDGLDRSSTAFIDFFEQWRSDFEDATGKEVERVYLRYRDGSNPQPYLSIYLPGPNPWFDYNYEIENTDLGQIIKFIPTGDFNDRGYGTELQPFLDFIFRPAGFYMQKMERVSSSRNGIGLIPVDDTTMLAHWYDF